MPVDPVLIIAGIVGLVIVVALIAWLVEKKRKEAWMALASDLGLEYRGRGNMHNEFGGFKIFHSGSNQRTKHLCKGTYKGVELTIGTFQYTTHKRDSDGDRKSTTHSFTVVVIRDENLDVPHFFLRKQGRFLDFLGSVFGGQDIDFHDDKPFSKAFVLQGDDEGATAALFEPHVREAFMEHKKSKMQFEGYEGALVAHWGKRLSPDEVRPRVDEVFALRDALKGRA